MKGRQHCKGKAGVSAGQSTNKHDKRVYLRLMKHSSLIASLKVEVLLIPASEDSKLET
jgi:hypothetical protein